jgi:hypothetical protein
MNGRSALVVSWVVLLSTLAAARADQTHFRQDIYVGADQQVNDLACFACSIHIRGHVVGDVAAFYGNVTLSPGASVSGEVAVIGGNLALESGSSVQGDIAVLGGRVHRSPEALTGGEVTVLTGSVWLLLMFVTPLVFLVLCIALIVWIVHLARRRSQAAHAYRRQP